MPREGRVYAAHAPLTIHGHGRQVWADEENRRRGFDDTEAYLSRAEWERRTRGQR